MSALVAIVLLAAPLSELRVCADPNNLPFSNERGEGFENQLAELVAKELGLTVKYTWWAQRRGFLRNTLSAKACDVVMGVPARLDRVLATRPYYRSTFAAVFPKGKGVASLDDPKLKALRIGAQLVGDDGANPPPVEALTRRGLVENVRGYTVYGDYARENPSADVVEAVRRGEVDVALAWGPLAGFFASRGEPRLGVVALNDDGFAFDIAVGVRKSDAELRDRIDAALAKRKKEIDALLDAFSVPRVGSSTPGSPSGGAAGDEVEAAGRAGQSLLERDATGGARSTTRGLAGASGAAQGARLREAPRSAGEVQRP